MSDLSCIICGKDATEGYCGKCNKETYELCAFYRKKIKELEEIMGLSISPHHAGQLCYKCEKPIYGDGVITNPLGTSDDWGCTSYHPNCYKQENEEYCDKLHKKIKNLEEKLENIKDLIPNPPHYDHSNTEAMISIEELFEEWEETNTETFDDNDRDKEYEEVEWLNLGTDKDIKRTIYVDCPSCGKYKHSSPYANFRFSCIRCGYVALKLQHETEGEYKLYVKYT